MAGIPVGRARAFGGAVPALAAAATGGALLILRPLAVPDASRAAALLMLVYAAVLAVSIAPDDERAVSDARPLHPALVAAAGAAAVLAIKVTASRVADPAWNRTAVVLALAAAVAEEAYFRRLLYGRLARFGPVAAVGATAVLFAAMHYQGYGFAAMPLDLGAGLLLGWQRWASGTWLVPAATHAFANVLASF